jgi:membrane-bound metal-dependent hydrolase YbcI (DUF457 family)
MDIVHHTFIGGVGFVALAAQQQELAGLGFLAGSVFPDLDVAFMAGGERFYLKHHQGPTHSLPCAPLYAALLAAVPALQVGWDWAVYAGLLAGLCVHVLLDLFNTFGIQILWPLTRRRFCFDAVFFIDTVAWTLTLGFLALALTGSVPAGRAAIVYAALFAAYVAAKFVLQRRTRRRLGVDFAIPSAFNPFGFLVFSKRDGRLETAAYNAFTGTLSAKGELPAATPETAELAQKSGLFRDMQSILRGLQITRIERDALGTTVIAQDLAVRNFGGKFGRTELRFDPDGRLVDEMAHI